MGFEDRVIAHRNPSVMLAGTTFDRENTDAVRTGLSGDEVVMAQDSFSLGGQTYTVVSELTTDEAFRSAYETLVVIVIGGLWWGRNISVYGWPDLMGLGRHDAVVVGQPRTADWIADQGFMPYVTNGLAITFRSWWGQFGWMGVPMPGWVYRVLLAFTLVSYAGNLDIGIVACRRSLPRVQRMLGYLEDSLAELESLAGIG